MKVCTLLLTKRFRHSFSSSATPIDTTVPRTILATAMITVFMNTLSISGIEKMYLKLSSPHQGLSPNSPRAGLNFLNAMVSPYSGIYEKMNTSTTLGSIIKCNGSSLLNLFPRFSFIRSILLRIHSCKAFLCSHSGYRTHSPYPPNLNQTESFLLTVLVILGICLRRYLLSAKLIPLLYHLVKAGINVYLAFDHLKVIGIQQLRH